ncbi:MAG: ribosome silencing factor [Kiritimatiellae bacterium]|jgi:ribosome-associated protein|nr:ribosome silencing factor [Kiritimatiellia bacterium]
MNSEQQAKEASRALEDAKASDVKIYDMRGKSSLADFYIVATGTAAPHLKALVRQLPKKAYRVSGDPESGWIVADYVDIVVHVFSPEARAYYALEKLWVSA